jgi:hypothetical protein
VFRIRVRGVGKRWDTFNKSMIGLAAHLLFDLFFFNDRIACWPGKRRKVIGSTTTLVLIHFCSFLCSDDGDFCFV